MSNSWVLPLLSAQQDVIWWHNILQFFNLMHNSFFHTYFHYIPTSYTCLCLTVHLPSSCDGTPPCHCWPFSSIREWGCCFIFQLYSISPHWKNIIVVCLVHPFNLPHFYQLILCSGIFNRCFAFISQHSSLLSSVKNQPIWLQNSAS